MYHEYSVDLEHGRCYYLITAFTKRFEKDLKIFLNFVDVEV
ncbi:hypothetical protein KIS4809_5758 [Bacillus sp. ZZV12-4809]|nr:hypothetical protein KIS4809_5758 [Bacillus sp. ZZV12-4809]